MTDESKQNKRTYAVIGDPIAHSRSPELYAPMFEQANIDADFLRLRVTREELPRIRDIAAGYALDGFAVTMPHKRAILEYCDAVDGSAVGAGCGNIVTISEGVFRCFNTDGEGAVNALREAGVFPGRGMQAVILGSGGAAKAAAAALRSEGCGVLNISRRHEPGPESSMQDGFLDLRILENCIAIAERITGCMSFADIVINATPLGMEGIGDYSDLSFVKKLKASCCVFDFVYHRDGSDTSLIAAAKQAGLRTVGGDRLLYHQGLLAFKLWTGIEYKE